MFRLPWKRPETRRLSSSSPGAYSSTHSICPVRFFLKVQNSTSVWTEEDTDSTKRKTRKTHNGHFMQQIYCLRVMPQTHRWSPFLSQRTPLNRITFPGFNGQVLATDNDICTTPNMQQIHLPLRVRFSPSLCV